jgi:WD40 repeat protein
MRPSARVTAIADSPGMAAKRRTEPARLQRILSGQLDWIVMKCLEKDRNRRYQTANDLVRDIESHLADRPVLARPAGLVDRTWRWCRRNRYVAALLAVVGMLVVLMAMGASIGAVRLQRESTAARAAEEQALAAEKSRRHELVEAYLAKARSVPPTGVFAERDAGIAAIRGALAAVPWHELREEQQNLVNAAVPLLISSELRPELHMPLGIYHHNNAFHEVDVDPQFQFAAYPVESRKSTIIERLGTGESRQFHLDEADPLQSGIYHAFSPNGRWLLARYLVQGAGWRYRIWNVSTGALAFRLDNMPSAEPPAFDSDEQHVLFQHGDNRSLRKFNIETGQEVATSPPRFRVSRPAYSPDGKYLAIASGHLAPEIVDPATWDTIAVFTETGPAASVAWHPTELWAVFGLSDGHLYRWRADLHTAAEKLNHAHEKPVDKLVFSPDGRLLASSDAGNRFLVRRLRDNHILASGNGCALRFSSDGCRIAVLDTNQLTVYQIVESPVYRQILETAHAAEFSPDGRWLGVSGLRGVRLFDAGTLELAADLGLDECGPSAFHPHGKSVSTFGYFSQVWDWPLSDTAIGPPQPVVPGAFSMFRLQPQHQGRHAAWSGDGRWLAFADFRNDKVILWDASSNTTREFSPVIKPIQVAVSPNGEWLAAAQWITNRTIVWNIADGREVLSTEGHMGIAFSPDGKWFAVRTVPSIDLYELPSWQRRHAIAVESEVEQQQVTPSFQPGGQLIAISDLSQRVRLYDRETAAEVATLDDRDSNAASWLSFSADGVRLAVTRADRVAVWDLAQLTQALGELGLHANGLPAHLPHNWPRTLPHSSMQIDRGPLPPAERWYALWQRLAEAEAWEGNWPDAVANMNRGLLQLPDEPATKASFLALRGTYLQRNLSFAAARDDWEAALQLVPDESTAATGLARLFVMGPPELRDPRRTVSLAATLALDDKTKSTAQLLQAMARVRLEQSEASDRETLASANGTDSALDQDWRTAAGYFLAMVQFQNGETERAAETFAATAALHDEHRDSLLLDRRQELDRLKSEAEAARGKPP